MLKLPLEGQVDLDLNSATAREEATAMTVATHDGGERVLVKNARIWQWTHDKCTDQPAYQMAEWMLVAADGKIEQIGVGSPPNAGNDARQVDLNGALVLPGLQDAHIHAYYMGESAEFINLSGCASFDELKERLRKYDRANPEKSWIVGFGWEQDALSDTARYPTRHDIDEVIKDRPVMLHRACWHIAVANSKAFEVAGLDVNRREWEVASGEVDVDEHGATGILREAAVELIAKHTTESSDEIRLKYLRASLRECIGYGLTAIQTNDHHAWELYRKLEANGELPIRVYLTVPIDELGHQATPKAGTSVGRLLSCKRIKIFSDGSLGAETAAMREPYRNTTNRGILMDTDEQLLKKVTDATDAGYQLEIHAIAEQVLTALRKAQVAPDRRPVLTHCQVLGEDLIAQMKEQGVIGNIQPSFTITDGAFARKRIPEHVIPFSYCWKRMMKSGVVCAGGSDAPIETCNPFQGIFDAIYRHRPNNPSDIFLPDECLTFEDALSLYTKNASFACMEEKRLGNLQVGYQADFVVLREDITNNHEALCSPTLVQSVWVSGKKSYEYDPNVTPSTSPDFSQSSLPGKNGRVRICACCRR
ncbi:TPA: hypothetical protein N0F65_011786 [Lagenidium giganteum]|uniref:Amidohydrolase 3 domain-containing protein n=1 Tax=Lagenidium giganteum TaxID=4803 RepID=A0AAV2YNF9_9STRA|nr:TPA: hypothetical protein N0F65_011786 [Lagenidium giganteum]